MLNLYTWLLKFSRGTFKFHLLYFYRTLHTTDPPQSLLSFSAVVQSYHVFSNYERLLLSPCAPNQTSPSSSRSSPSASIHYPAPSPKPIRPLGSANSIWLLKLALPGPTAKTSAWEIPLGTLVVHQPIPNVRKKPDVMVIVPSTHRHPKHCPDGTVSVCRTPQVITRIRSRIAVATAYSPHRLPRIPPICAWRSTDVMANALWKAALCHWRRKQKIKRRVYVIQKTVHHGTNAWIVALTGRTLKRVYSKRDVLGIVTLRSCSSQDRGTSDSWETWRLQMSESCSESQFICIITVRWGRKLLVLGWRRWRDEATEDVYIDFQLANFLSKRWPYIATDWFEPNLIYYFSSLSFILSPFLSIIILSSSFTFVLSLLFYSQLLLFPTSPLFFFFPHTPIPASSTSTNIKNTQLQFSLVQKHIFNSSQCDAWSKNHRIRTPSIIMREQSTERVFHGI